MGHAAYSSEPVHLVHSQPAKLPVSLETLISQIAPPTPGFSPPQGRMDLMVTDSDFVTLLADVTITHPNPSLNQTITTTMLCPGHFASHRENTKRTKYAVAARLVGAKFFPLVMETLGTMGPSFIIFLRKSNFNSSEILVAQIQTQSRK